MPISSSAKKLYMFFPSTLWLLVTIQFNEVRASAGNHFCLVLSEKDQQFKAYYEKLFCHAFKSFDAHTKMSPEKLADLDIDLSIPVTHEQAEFHCVAMTDVDPFLFERKSRYKIFFIGDEQAHLDLADRKKQQGYDCSLLQPISNRGKFDVEDLNEMRSAIKGRYDFGQLERLVFALDLDDTTIKVNRQTWCLGMNFFNPHALLCIGELYNNYKDQMEMRLLAITTRKQQNEKKAPAYFHAHHLFREFLGLLNIPPHLCREDQHVFYTDGFKSAKYEKLTQLYRHKLNSFVVLFDDTVENWMDGNPYFHLHFVKIKKRMSEDDALLYSYQAHEECVPDPGPRLNCCEVLFKRFRQSFLSSSSSTLSQPLMETNRPSFNTQSK